MSKRMTLYIGGREADFSDDTIILYTYRSEDLANPTSVRNTGSRPVTLPGTPRNNAIFGDFFQVQRITAPGIGGGPSFNPMTRTPFSIYDAQGTIVERGYCKLSGVAVKGSSVTYSVCLYGGLGDLLYALMYDEEGDALSLASLDYGPTALDFYITREAVREAWDVLAGDPGSPRWEVINFAPCYNGIPDRDFDADRALVKASGVGLETSVTKDGKTYTPRSGYALVTMKDKLSEWDTKDLRSYLQRPVLKVSALFDALVRYAATKGYTLALDPAFFSATNPLYSRTWITLPLLSSLAAGSETRTDTVALPGHDAVPAELFEEVDLPAVPLGSSFEVDVTIRPTASCPQLAGRSKYLGFATLSDGGDYRQAVLYEVLLYDGAGNVIDSSDVVSIQSAVPGGSYDTNDILTMISAADFDPLGSGDAGATQVGAFGPDGAWSGAPLTFHLEGTGATKIVIHSAVVVFRNTTSLDDLPGALVPATTWPTADWSAIDEALAIIGAAGDASYTYTSGAVMRSGALVRKGDLLGGSATPADYLLGYCRTMGLYLYFDKRTNTVSVLTRASLYDNAVAIDIDTLIDRGNGMEITPVVPTSKFYDWTVPAAGEYADYYRNVFGREYGLHRVNTGYGFNAERVDVLGGIPFRGAVEVLERRKYFVNIEEDDTPIPSPFIDGGKYTLYAPDGSTLDVDLPTPSDAATIAYFDANYKTYDRTPKVQLHSAGGTPDENRDTLLFYRGPAYGSAYDRFTLTDDSPVMDGLNDSTPCWILEGYLSEGAGYQVGDRVTLPSFGRYRRDAFWRVADSLDLGTPKEIDDPRTDVTAMEGKALYPRLWRDYIADRYDLDTKVVKVRVDLSRLRPDVSLLRRFFWFDGCLWVLNAIEDADPLRPELTDCVFVRVRSMASYIDGQTIPTGGDADDPDPGDEPGPGPAPEISFSPASLIFPAAGGSLTLTVTANGSWTLTLPSWLVADKTSGTGDDTVTLTAAASGLSSHSGVITGTMAGASPATATATQPGQNATYALVLSTASVSFSAAGGSSPVTAKGRTYVDGVLYSETDLTAGDLTFSKGAGDTYGQITRSGLTFSAANLGTIERAAVSVPWSVSWNGTGATASLTTSQALNTVVSTAQESRYSARMAIANPWYDGSTTIVPYYGGTNTLVITGIETVGTLSTWSSGATSYVEGSSSSWTPADGWGPHISVQAQVPNSFFFYPSVMSVYVAQNSGGQRTGTYTLTYDGETLDTMMLTQAGLVSYTLSVSDVLLAFPRGGANLPLTIYTSDPNGWVIDTSDLPAWITLSASSGTGGATINVGASPNSGAARSGWIVVRTYSGSNEVRVNVTQEEAFWLEVSPNNLLFGADGTPAAGNTFTVRGNQPWELVREAAWATPSVYSGTSGDTTVAVSVDVYEGSSRRDQILQVRGLGDTSQVLNVVIYQDAPAQLAGLSLSYSSGNALLPDGSNYATLSGTYVTGGSSQQVSGIAPYLLPAPLRVDYEGGEYRIRWNKATYGTTPVAAGSQTIYGQYAGTVSSNGVTIAYAANAVTSTGEWIYDRTLRAADSIGGAAVTLAVNYTSSRSRTLTWSSGAQSEESEAIECTFGTTVGTLTPGGSPGLLSLAIPQNGTGSSRTITVSMYATGQPTVTHVITQAPYVSPYTVDARLSADEFTAAGGTATLTVVTGGGQSWTAHVIDVITGLLADWASIENGALTVDPNDTGSDRSGEVVVEGSVEGSDTVLFIQRS